ncbi:MAG: AAA family ATPase [SAR324 cluster bacterium]|nr:AAA family ATPase [SAR324 cluster bacterium]
MQCPKCQHENPEGRKFCNKCGTALLEKCPNCNVELDPGSEFCGECGHDLSKPVKSSDSSSLPLETTAKEPDSPAPAGERRQATIVFSDLSGYTSMSEKLDPEEVEGIMSRIKAEAVKIVESHGGIVSQFVGDEVLALFGIPTAHEDDPRRAVRAALELHELVSNMSPEVEEQIGRPLRMHTGIDTGLVVTSTRDVRDGTVGVTGDVVNTGARLKALAEDDQVLISPETRRLIAPFYTTEMLEPVTLKGKDQPIIPFQVTGESGVQSRFEAAEKRGFTPYIGREVELTTLNACLEKAVAGQGQFVTVVGEAGLGKSRLLYEFRRGIDRAKVTVSEGRCQSYGTATPYLPLIDTLRRGLDLRDDKSPEQLLEKAVVNLKAIDPALEEYLPCYLHLLSIPSEEFALPTDLTGEALRVRLQEAYAAIVTQTAAQKPMVLILEDWHWTDEASDAALRYLLGLIAPHRLLVVIIHRPEYEGSWSGLTQHTNLPLAVLGAEHCAAIVGAVLEAERLPEGLAKLIHGRTGGNPFFIEEMCQDLLEEGTVLVKDGQAALTRSLENLSLPNSVQAVIRSRLDRLGEDHREVLRLASVIGREFGQRLLETAHPGENTLAPFLETLKSQEVIQQISVLPEVAYLFKHVLTQVVVYDTLLIERRKDLHEIVGRAMERLYADRLEEHYETLAHHFESSNDAETAVKYMELAGDKAAGFFSLDDARARFRKALNRLDGMEMTPERKAHRIDLNLKWSAVSHYAAKDEHLHVLGKSMQYAQDIGDEHRLAKTTYWIGRTHFVMGDFARALSVFERCTDIAKGLSDDGLLALLYNIIGRACLLTGEYPKGIENLEKGIPAIEGLGNLEEVAYSTALLGVIYATMGDFPRGIRLTEKALKIAKSINNLTREAHAHVLLGIVNFWKSNWKVAINHITKGVEIADKSGDAILAGYGLGFEGYSRFMLGESEKGIEQMAEGEHLIGTTDSHMLLVILNSLQAETYAVTGSPEYATHFANQALEYSRSGEKWGEVIAHRALAIAAAAESPCDWSRVEAHMEKSLALAQDRGERPNLAIAHFRYAELFQQKGDLPKACENLDQAIAFFRDMEMPWWLEQAEELRERLPPPS